MFKTILEIFNSFCQLRGRGASSIRAGATAVRGEVAAVAAAAASSAAATAWGRLLRDAF